MGNQWQVGLVGTGAHFAAGAAPLYLSEKGATVNINDDVSANKSAVATLLKELDDAQITGKSQTVRELRDKLNEKRKALGDEEFKKILEQLKEEWPRRWLDLLKMLFPDLFPDEPSPSPQPSPGGGGGGGGRVNPTDFGPVQAMTNKPFTEGAKYTDYKIDKSNPGQKPGMSTEAGNIWSGFKQGPDGNCTTVAAIKAAMMKFGQKPTDIFRDVTANGDGWDIQMRDGFQLHLSKSELRQAAQQARFMGDDAGMMTDANFLYAASAKRAHMEGNQGWGFGNDANARRSFADALVSLNDGEMLSEGLDRLGLKGLYRQSSSSELASGVLGVVAYGGHAMASIGGHVELWGGRGGQPQNGGEAYAFK